MNWSLRISVILGLLTAVVLSKPGDTTLVRVRDYIPDIVINLKYATTDNFTGVILYNSNECYLAYAAVKHLSLVQDSLRNILQVGNKHYPKGLGLMIWDGYRPHSVQWKMWEQIPDSRYVADPSKGSFHNRGGAMDLTLVDLATGQALQMPTAYDHFGPEAHHDYENLPVEIMNNRELLKTLMETVGGFHTYAEEWWHYNYPPSSEWPLLDIEVK